MTGGERAPAEAEGAPAEDEGAPAEDEGAPAEGGRRRSPEVGSQIFSPHHSPAFWPQTFLQNTLGDLNSPANYKA